MHKKATVLKNLIVNSKMTPQKQITSAEKLTQNNIVHQTQ